MKREELEQRILDHIDLIDSTTRSALSNSASSAGVHLQAKSTALLALATLNSEEDNKSASDEINDY